MRIFNLFPITPRDLTCIPVDIEAKLWQHLYKVTQWTVKNK